MKNTDIALTLTTSYQLGSTLAQADIDHNKGDIPDELKNVTVTNQTDVTISVKGTVKGTPSGIGRTIASGKSFNFLTLSLKQTYFKAASSPTGSVVLTNYIDN